MYIVVFGNHPDLSSEDRHCMCPTEAAMFSVFDALCLRYLCVVVLIEGSNKIVRSYNNTRTMGVPQ